MDFNFRQYDPQIGRFLGVDPLADYYGQDRYSPYAAMGNQPESTIDPNGLYQHNDNLMAENFARIEAIGRQSMNDFLQNSIDVYFGKVNGDYRNGSIIDDFKNSFKLHAGQVGSSSGGPSAYVESELAEGDNDKAKGDSEKKKKMKPASEYDYSQDEIPEKLEDDWDYIKNGDDGNMFTRWIETVVRDWNASSAEEKKDLITTVATTPMPLGRMGIRAAKGIGKSVNQLNKAVQAGKAPKSIKRFDKGKDVNQAVDHVHFKDGSALRRDGVWRHGQRQLTNEEIKFLKDNGWTIP